MILGGKEIKMEYNIEFMKVSDLKPYENNIKIHDEQQIQQIINSIKEFGFRQNLVIDKDNVVIIGHGRLAAAERMGLETVPCVRASDLTEEQIKALRIADNKLTEKGLWDNDALSAELKEIANFNSLDMTDFGFGDFELTILTGDFEPEPYDEEDIKEYKDMGNTVLSRKRVIISYDPDSEDKVCEMLGLSEVKKVVYELEELMK